MGFNSGFKGLNYYENNSLYVYIIFRRQRTQKGSNIEIPTRGTCYRIYFYLTIALHVSGIIITHFQEHKTTVTTACGNRYTVLLSVAIVEELELV